MGSTPGRGSLSALGEGANGSKSTGNDYIGNTTMSDKPKQMNTGDDDFTMIFIDFINKKIMNEHGKEYDCSDGQFVQVYSAFDGTLQILKQKSLDSKAEQGALA